MQFHFFDGFDDLVSLFRPIHSVVVPSPVYQILVRSLIRMSYCTHQHIVRIPKSLNQSQSLWSQFLQQLFSAFVDELESIRSQDSSFVDSACPFEDLLKTVEDAEFSEDCLEFGTLHLLALFKIEAVDSDDGVSDSCINESESCVGVPDLFLAETFFRSLCEFQSHIFH